MPKPITAPSMTVHRNPPAGAPGSRGTSYQADGLHVIVSDGRYVLAFECSGTLETIPADEVAGIDFDAHGAQHCYRCHEALKTWPANDPGFGPEELEG